MIKKIFFFLSFIILGCSSPKKGLYPISDHYDGETFYWQDPISKKKSSESGKGLWQILKWRFTGKREAWPKWIENQAKPQLPLAEKILPHEIYATFINHASYLIQMQGLNFLTDPIFSQRASPFSWIGPSRVRAPGLTMDQLPMVNLVLLSHNHYDHMDIETLKTLQEKSRPLMIVPLGDKKTLAAHGIDHVMEMDWWQTHEITTPSLAPGGSPLLHRITFVPAHHWSARTPFDRNESLWGGYIVESQGKVFFFAGDSGYGGFFQEIGRRFPLIHLSLLPIGAYEPRWFMQEAHMNPEEAVMAHLDLQSEMALGIHFGTFQLTDEAFTAPVKLLEESLRKHRVPLETFLAPEVGKTTKISITTTKKDNLKN